VIYKKSIIGNVRNDNQDYCKTFTNNDIELMVLCDGMGGHEGGFIASSTAVNVIGKYFLDANINDVLKNSSLWFQNVLKISRKEMKKKANNNNRLLDMGTTLTAALIDKKKKEIVIFNVGDSRTYIYDGILHQITVDHNLRNYKIENDGYTEEEASKIWGGNLLTSALGPTKSTRLEVFKINMSRKMKFIILTSDGLHDFITKNDFEILINQNENNIFEIGDSLVDKALKNKSTDNISILIWKGKSG